MTYKNWYLLLAIFLFQNLTLAAINGTISDKSGHPLIGANILLEGTDLGTAANEDGTFVLEYKPESEYSLEVTHIGFKTKRITTSETTDLVIILDKDVFSSESVVVTGVGSERSIGHTEVSVSRFNGSDLAKTISFSDVSQMLYGKMSGVDIRKASGNIGGGWRFDVRAGGGLNGDEQPIIYIDGIRMDNDEYYSLYAGGQGVSTLADLNPEDIESVEILKGPAGATSYGTNSSNGVVLITTKRGGDQNRTDDKNYTIKYKQVTGTNEQSYIYDNEKDGLYSADDLNAVHTPGRIDHRNLNISGGTPALNYYIGLDDRYEEGLTVNKKQNYMDRSSARLNVDITASKNLSFSVLTNYVRNIRTIPDNDNSILGWLANTYWAVAQYDENGDPVLNSADDNDGSGRANGTQQYEPFYFLDSSYINKVYYWVESKRFIGSISVNFQLADGLVLKGRVGIDDSRTNEEKRHNSSFPDIWSIENKQGFIRQNQELTYEIGSSYIKSIGSVESKTSITTQAYDQKKQGYGFKRLNYIAPDISITGFNEEMPYKDEEFFHFRDGGTAFTEELSMNGKYFLTFSHRRDFGSTLGTRANQISYTGFRFGCRADRAFNSFLPSFINLLKPRIAYGESGILPGLTDNIPILWETSSEGESFLISNIGNEDIQPESIKEIEFGFDAQFDLPSKLGFLSLEYTLYNQRAEESIVYKENSPSTGLTASSIPVNVGEMEMSGTEMLLNYSTDIGALIGRPNLFQVDLSYSSSHNKNKVIALSNGEFDAQPIYSSFNTQVIQSGLPKYGWYNLFVLGAKFDDATGLYSGVQVDTVTQPMWDFDSTYLSKYAGATGVGSPYKVYLGLSSPSSLRHLSLNLRIFKNIKIYALLNWKSGHLMANETKRYGVYFGSNRTRNELADRLGYGGEVPLSGIEPLVDFDENGNIVGIKFGKEEEYEIVSNDYALTDPMYPANYLSDASFYRIKELSISYNMVDLLSRFKLKTINDIQIYYSIQNYWTKTNYSGSDPEVNWSGANAIDRGQDFLTAQHPRVYTLGLTITF